MYSLSLSDIYIYIYMYLYHIYNIQSAHDDSATFHTFDVCADMYVRVHVRCMCGVCAGCMCGMYVRGVCAGCMCGYFYNKGFPSIAVDFFTK